MMAACKGVRQFVRRATLDALEESGQYHLDLAADQALLPVLQAAGLPCCPGNPGSAVTAHDARQCRYCCDPGSGSIHRPGD
jgi:hypothetical protein